MWRTAMFLYSFEFTTLIVGAFVFVLWSLFSEYPRVGSVMSSSERGVKKRLGYSALRWARNHPLVG